MYESRNTLVVYWEASGSHCNPCQSFPAITYVVSRTYCQPDDTDLECGPNERPYEHQLYQIQAYLWRHKKLDAWYSADLIPTFSANLLARECDDPCVYQTTQITSCNAQFSQWRALAQTHVILGTSVFYIAEEPPAILYGPIPDCPPGYHNNEDDPCVCDPDAPPPPSFTLVDRSARPPTGALWGWRATTVNSGTSTGRFVGANCGEAVSDTSTVETRSTISTNTVRSATFRKRTESIGDTGSGSVTNSLDIFLGTREITPAQNAIGWIYTGRTPQCYNTDQSVTTIVLFAYDSRSGSITWESEPFSADSPGNPPASPSPGPANCFTTTNVYSATASKTIAGVTVNVTLSVTAPSLCEQYPDPDSFTGEVVTFLQGHPEYTSIGPFRITSTRGAPCTCPP